MKCYLIQLAMLDIDGHPFTENYTYLIILGNNTKYVVGTPPSTSTPRVSCGIYQCDFSMWCLSDEADTAVLHS